MSNYEFSEIIVNLTIDRNTDRVKTWTMYPGNLLYVTPVDLTNCSGVVQVFSDPSLKTSLLTISSAAPGANGGIVLGGALGTLTLSALKPSSLLFGPGSFPWKWYHTWADGTTVTMMRGNWIVRA